jgi:hypothetical protein
MAVRQNGRTGKSGLIFHFDTGDFYNSYKGEPTTNMNGTGQPYIYSWWSRNTQTITVLNETYQGQPIYRVSLSLDIPDQVSYANSRWGAGTGWYLGGQTYNANTPYMVSTIYRPVSHSDIQIYGHPSNIGGWGLNIDGSVNYDGDWKLHRIDRNFSTIASDARYFHIHTPTAVLNDVISVDITHMQIEAKSQRTYFTRSTRSGTQGLLDLTGNYTIDISNTSFSSDATSQIVFDGTNDYIDIQSQSLINGTADFTIEAVYNMTGQNGGEIFGNYGPSYGAGLWFSGMYGIYIQGAVYVPGYPISNGKYHMVATRQSGFVRLYLNGVLVNAGTLSSSVPSNINYRIGADVNSTNEPFTGNIYSVKVYNRALKDYEIFENYKHYRTRYSLPSPSFTYAYDGSTSDRAVSSARHLKNVGYTTNGNYWLQPPGTSPFLAYVEFDSNGGDPWVHVGTIDDEDAPSNDPNYHKWSNDMNGTQSCPPWDDESVFGGSTPTFVSDYKNAGWSTIPFKQIMIKDAGGSQRKLLHTNEGQIKSSNSSLREWFQSLKWGAVGSDASNSAYATKRVTAIDITNYGINDPVLQSSGKSKLLFKYGEIDGAQDGNKDRTMIAWHRHDAGDGVDGPSGLGCFTNRGGTIDYRDIVPGSVYGSGQDFPPSNIGGSYYYSIWIR